MRRYDDGTLQQVLGEVRQSTATAGTLLKTNAELQERLVNQEDGSRDLRPVMTTLGIEVEFSQQSDTVPPGQSEAEVVLKSDPNNRLNNAHIEVARAPGMPLFGGIPFLLETDAGEALEFVTSPLLAPLDPSGQHVAPDKAWLNQARRALEFDLRRRAESPQTLEALVGDLNTEYGLELDLGSGLGPYVYGPMTKHERSRTSAQLNFMTSLRHYGETNLAGNSDPATREIFTLLALKVSHLAREPNTDPAELRAYVYAVAQKLREIQGAFNDRVFSILLAADDQPPEPGSDDATIVDWSKENAPRVGKTDRTNRQALAFEASRIKDQAQLWLKASYHQVLAAVPEPYRQAIVDAIEAERAAIVEQLYRARITSVESTLARFPDQQRARAMVEAWFNQALANTSGDALAAKAAQDTEQRPQEQRDREHRDPLVGARADTYAPVDTSDPQQPLFLVETRKTSRYLDLGKQDTYRFAKVAEEVRAKLSQTEANRIFLYFRLRDEEAAALRKVGQLEQRSQATATASLMEIHSGDYTEDILTKVSNDLAGHADRAVIIASLKATCWVGRMENRLTADGLLKQAQAWYESI